jgi:hypothetical protein
MHQIFEGFLSVGIPAAGLVSYALVLGRREDRDRRKLIGKTEPANRKDAGTPILINPDPDGHLGRRGTE